MADAIETTGRKASGSPFGWLGELGGKERKTLWACMGGWGLDGMDVQIYSFVIPALIAGWGISQGQAGQVATAASLASALGGWLAGILADRIGRVRTLQISIAWFAGFTFLSGLAQTYEQLLGARTLMGLGFGGEWAAGAVLLAETVRPQHRGKALGFMQSSWAIGWAMAAVFATLLFSLLPQETAWRVLFFVGILPAGLIFFVRRFVEEPEIYLRNKAALTAAGDRPSLLEIFRPPLLKTTVLGALLGAGAQGGYFAVTTWVPTFLKTERHISVIGSSGYLAVLITGSFCGYLTGAYLADRIGRRNTFLVFAIGAFAVVIGYTAVPFGNLAMLFLGAPLGFFSSGVFSAQGAFYAEQFPTRVRGLGQGFTYNVGRALAAFAPMVVGYLGDKSSLGLAIGLLAGTSFAVMAIAAFLLPETRGKVLEP